MTRPGSLVACRGKTTSALQRPATTGVTAQIQRERTGPASCATEEDGRRTSSAAGGGAGRRVDVVEDLEPGGKYSVKLP